MTRTNLYISLYGILPLKRKHKWVNRALREGGKETTASPRRAWPEEEEQLSFLGSGQAGPGDSARWPPERHRLATCTAPNFPRQSSPTGAQRDCLVAKGTPGYLFIRPTPGQMQEMDPGSSEASRNTACRFTTALTAVERGCREVDGRTVCFSQSQSQPTASSSGPRVGRRGRPRLSADCETHIAH